MYPVPQDQGLISSIIEIFRYIMKHTQVTGTVNKNNAGNFKKL
jgi:hypothetical protein